MTTREQELFDEWWRENRRELITIYNEGIDPNLVVMDIAEAVWEGSCNAKAKAENDQTRKENKVFYG